MPSPDGKWLLGADETRYFPDGIAIPGCPGDANGLLRNWDSISRGPGNLERASRENSSKFAGLLCPGMAPRSQLGQQ